MIAEQANRIAELTKLVAEITEENQQLREENKQIKDLKGRIERLEALLATKADTKSSKSVYICGPGEARKELRNRMDVKHSTNGDVVLDAADSMTNAQVVAKIRRHFQLG